MQEGAFNIGPKTRRQVIHGGKLVVDRTRHAVDQRHLPGRVDHHATLLHALGNGRGGHQGIGRGELAGPERRFGAFGHRQLAAGHRMERQVTALHHAHQSARQPGIKRITFDETTQYRGIRQRHGAHRGIALGQRHVGADVARQIRGLTGVTHGDGQDALGRLGVVGKPRHLAPRQALVALAPGLADRLAGVAARSSHRAAIELREQVLVQAPAEIGFVVAATLNQRLQGQLQDDAGLRRGAGLEALVVASRLRRGVTVDPLAIDAMLLVQVVVPVRPQRQRVTHECTHQGALDTTLPGNVCCVSHALPPCCIPGQTLSGIGKISRRRPIDPAAVAAHCRSRRWT